MGGNAGEMLESMENPLVQALLVCEQVITDERTHRKSLINVFNHVHTRAFPLVFPELTVFASLTNGNGALNCELRCVKGDGVTPIFSTRGPIEFPDPNALVDLVFSLNDLAFPEAGTYSFLLFSEDDLLAERRFHVAQAR